MHKKKSDYQIEFENRLFSLIPTGRENRISGAKLADALGISSRSLKDAIKATRLDASCPFICSDWVSGGYFFPKYDGEISSIFHQWSESAHTRYLVLARLKRELKQRGIDTTEL